MIDKLEYFIALAREQHFGRAAEECGVTQPTLSAGIKQLEDTLGVMLVQRGSRFQGLTPEGSRVLEWARRIVGDARTMREEMRAARQGLAGHVRIAAIPTALAMTPRLTTPFRAKHPGVTFSILSRNSIEVLTLLDNFEIDIGITYLENEPLGRVASVPLYSERYQLITAAGNLYSDRATVTWAEVAQLPLCLLTPDMQNRRIINHHLEDAGVHGQADAGIELDDRAVLAYPHRQMVVDHAAQPRRDFRLRRADPRDPDRRAGCQPSGRAGRRAPRAAHAAGLGDAARGAAGRGRAWLVSIENFYRSTEQRY